MVKHQRPGFTLIELLIVCAIIAILASLAVVNLLEAQTRSKVSRVKSDMFAMATAVESYAVDHTRLPIRHHRWERAGNEQTDHCPVPVYHHAPFPEKIFDPDPGEQTAAVGLHVLTTPVAYMTSLPRDVFNIPARSVTNTEIYFSGA